MNYENPNPTITESNVTKVGFDMKMTLHHLPLPTTPPSPTNGNIM